MGLNLKPHWNVRTLVALLVTVMFIIAWSKVGYVTGKTAIMTSVSYGVQPQAVAAMVHDGIQVGFFAGFISAVGIYLLGDWLLRRSYRKRGTP